jgi:ABC-type uncharacterized transport system involved in gliding motility auxiliary subunit
VAVNPSKKRKLLTWLNVTLMTLLMAAFLVGVNLVARTRFARIDMTTDKVWEISPQSRQILKNIPRDLKIYINPFIGPETQDKSLQEAWRRTVNLLSEMANQNPKIKLTAITETQIQAEVAAQFSQPQPNMMYFIYKTVEDKPLSRAISIGDLYQGNPQTGDILDYNGESRLITTIAQLVSDRKAVVYATVGHQENPPNVADRRGWSVLQGRLTALENTEFKPLELARVKEVPADADLVFIAAPYADFTTVETDALKKYWARGGRLFVAMHPIVPDKMGEFRAFLETCGVRVNRDIVIDAQREMGDPGMLVVREYGRHPVNQGMHGLPYRVALSCSVVPVAVNRRMQSMALFYSSKQTWAESDLPPKSTSKQTPGEPWGPVPLAVATQQDYDTGKPARLITWGGVAALTNEFNMRQADPDDFTLTYLLNNFRWLMERDITIVTPVAARQPRMKPFTPPPGAESVIGWISLAAIPFIGVLLGGLAWYFRRK